MRGICFVVRLNRDLITNTRRIASRYGVLIRYRSRITFPSFRCRASGYVPLRANQLDTYINGDDIFPLYSTESASISYLNKEQRIYSGIKVYDNFCNYMENLNNTEMINVPFAYGLMEQIIIMKYRIQYIFKFGKNLFTASKKKEIIELFDKLIMLHTQLVNMCVKENIRFPRIGNRNKIGFS